MSHPGHPWENSPIERWWNDFKLIWINKHPRPKTLAELEQLVKGAIEYFNTKRADYLASKNCIHSMSHPGHPWENSPIERWWNDFKLIWINKHPRPKTLAELEQLVKGAIEYFNTKRAYTSKNGLTAEQFRNQAA
ncbi:integrase core domain-containing protein [Ligilactobacillus murinus]|nr:integrase core domain-containing protein [Ligilactobacillus murinus]